MLRLLVPAITGSRLRAVSAAALLCLATWLQPPAAAQEASTPALKLQMLTAAFVYSFARFTEWPANASTTPLAICVHGDPGVADALEQLAGTRVVNGRRVTVVRPDSMRAARSCHVLFVGGRQAGDATQAIAATAGANILTIGDGDPFVRAGGIAGLLVEHDKMKFVVNADALERAGLRLSSKLLSLARIFREAPRAEP